MYDGLVLSEARVCVRRFDGLASEIAKMPNNTASVAWAFDNEILGDDVSPFAQIWMWIGEFFEKDCFGTLSP
jgi:hypothetical protein